MPLSRARDLLAWAQMLALAGEARRWEPKTPPPGLPNPVCRGWTRLCTRTVLLADAGAATPYEDRIKGGQTCGNRSEGVEAPR
jgi:hypothetical protein